MKTYKELMILANCHFFMAKLYRDMGFDEYASHASDRGVIFLSRAARSLRSAVEA